MVGVTPRIVGLGGVHDDCEGGGIVGVSILSWLGGVLLGGVVS